MSARNLLLTDSRRMNGLTPQPAINLRLSKRCHYRESGYGNCCQKQKTHCSLHTCASAVWKVSIKNDAVNQVSRKKDIFLIAMWHGVTL